MASWKVGRSAQNAEDARDGVGAAGAVGAGALAAGEVGEADAEGALGSEQPVTISAATTDTCASERVRERVRGVVMI
ncbi:hypothetical protein GCM10009678_33410 [Actinomadura kijaniata]